MLDKVALEPNIMTMWDCLKNTEFNGYLYLLLISVKFLQLFQEGKCLENALIESFLEDYQWGYCKTQKNQHLLESILS